MIYSWTKFVDFKIFGIDKWIFSGYNKGKRYYMGKSARYCCIEENNKLLQLNLTESAFAQTSLFERILGKTRFIYPTVLVGSTAALIISTLLQTPLAFLSQVIPASLVVSSVFYFPFNAFNKIFTATQLNNKALRTINKYYSKMRELESQKVRHKNQKSSILQRQQKLTSKLVKKLHSTLKFIYFLNKGYERKTRKGKDLWSLAELANVQLNAARNTIDKFIFHNNTLLSMLCPSKKSFINERTNAYYNNVLDQDEYFYDEYIYSGTHNECLVENDDILKRGTTYFKFVADKAGFEFEDDDTSDLQTINYTSLSEEPRQLVSVELPQASSKPIQSVEIMFRPQNPSDDEQNIK